MRNKIVTLTMAAALTMSMVSRPLPANGTKI